MKSKREKPERTLHFEDAARFNYALDTDKELQDGMTALALEFSSLTEEEYTEKFLRLLRRAGLDLSAGQLKVLLLLRKQTDQMLLREKTDGTKSTEKRGGIAWTS